MNSTLAADHDVDYGLLQLAEVAQLQTTIWLDVVHGKLGAQGAIAAHSQT